MKPRKIGHKKRIQNFSIKTWSWWHRRLYGPKINWIWRFVLYTGPILLQGMDHTLLNILMNRRLIILLHGVSYSECISLARSIDCTRGHSDFAKNFFYFLIFNLYISESIGRDSWWKTRNYFFTYISVLKCSACGHRISAYVQELPEDNGQDSGNVSNTISHDHHIHPALDILISNRYA
jgi:hypothetical protein